MTKKKAEKPEPQYTEQQKWLINWFKERISARKPRGMNAEEHKIYDRIADKVKYIKVIEHDSWHEDFSQLTPDSLREDFSQLTPAMHFALGTGQGKGATYFHHGRPDYLRRIYDDIATTMKTGKRPEYDNKGKRVGLTVGYLGMEEMEDITAIIDEALRINALYIAKAEMFKAGKQKGSTQDNTLYIEDLVKEHLGRGLAAYPTYNELWEKADKEKLEGITEGQFNNKVRDACKKFDLPNPKRANAARR